MFEKVRKYIELNNMFDECRGIIVGLSGGADSVCLLHVLVRLRESCEWELQAIHVNHGIRGEEAKRDEEFCRKLCEQLNVPLEVYSYNIPQIAKENHLTEEEAGRMKRYECFEKHACRNWRIAVAHHMNDQAETVLFNICRGSSVKGAGGMQPIRDNIIRPLLNCTRAEIENYLSEQGISFCQDSTNKDSDYSRNALRNNVMPMLMENINSKAVENIALFANRCSESERYIEEITEKKYRSCVSYRNRMLLLKRINQEDEYMMKRLVLKAVDELNRSMKDIGAIHLDRIIGLADAQNGSRCNVKNGLWAEKTKEGLLFYKEADLCVREPVNVQPPCEIIPWKDEGKFTFSVIDWTFNKKITNELYTKRFDYDKIKFSLQLRSWQPGDKIAIDNQGHHKTIKQCFVDMGIARVDKDNIILLADGSNIMWVVGGRIGADYKIDDNTQRVLEVRYRGGFNGES